MKQIILTLVVAAMTLGVSAQTKPVNTSASTIIWKAQKVTGAHEGTVNVKSGNLIFIGDALAGGDFVMDMNSIACTDLTGKGKSGLEGHLKSDDFFGAASFPEGKFTITKVVSRGKPGEYKIIGNLTIKGITKEIRFDAMVVAGKATGTIKIDRTDFNVKYGSGSFFDNLGDKTIYDEFDIAVSLSF